MELVVAGLVVYLPPLRAVFQTAPPPPAAMLLLVSFPFLVWGADEGYRWLRRKTETWSPLSSEPRPLA